MQNKLRLLILNEILIRQVQKWIIDFNHETTHDDWWANFAWFISYAPFVMFFILW